MLAECKRNHKHPRYLKVKWNKQITHCWSHYCPSATREDRCCRLPLRLAEQSRNRAGLYNSNIVVTMLIYTQTTHKIRAPAFKLIHTLPHAFCLGLARRKISRKELNLTWGAAGMKSTKVSGSFCEEAVKRVKSAERTLLYSVHITCSTVEIRP